MFFWPKLLGLPPKREIRAVLPPNKRELFGVEGREFITVWVDTEVMEGGRIKVDRESHEGTVEDDEVEPPIVVENELNEK